MINNALIEMERFESAKETENKLCWYKIIGNAKFSLYIPKWRCPNPWPARIYVQLVPRRIESDELYNLSEDLVGCDPSLKQEPIVTTVERVSEHTIVVRYRPLGNKSNWEIGEPYIPNELAQNYLRMRIIILWDITSRGMFKDHTKMAQLR